MGCIVDDMEAAAVRVRRRVVHVHTAANRVVSIEHRICMRIRAARVARVRAPRTCRGRPRKTTACAVRAVATLVVVTVVVPRATPSCRHNDHGVSPSGRRGKIVVITRARAFPCPPASLEATVLRVRVRVHIVPRAPVAVQAAAP
eukprot:Amastigsp_a847754_15.p4 type:complete len:145 gc:universal Amastigsp_a847754_15:358-792(+)